MSNPTTPAQAIAELKRELPAFAEAEDHWVAGEGSYPFYLRYEKNGPYIFCDRTKDGIFNLLLCKNQDTVQASAREKSLAKAIAALKQSAVDQMRVLELVL